MQEVVDLCRNPRNFDDLNWKPKQAIDDISISLFCITQWDTQLGPHDEFDDLTYEEYVAKFAVTDMPWPESKPFWDAIGWDISDGSGRELNCAHFFARQIIACEGDLVEGARLTLDGSGVYPFDDEGNLLTAEERWAESLEREAERYLANKKS